MYTKEIKKLFGKKKMSILNFKKAIKHLPSEEQQHWKEKVFITSFCHYHNKRITLKAFLKTFTKSHRQEYPDYITDHTLLGGERYQPYDSSILQKMVVFMEEDNIKPNRRHLAFCMQVAFQFKDRVIIDTQCNQMIKERITADALWEWYEKLTINDER